MPEIQTDNLELVLKSTQTALASIEALSPEARAEVSPVWLARMRAATQPDPWLHGFAMVHRGTGIVIGECGFKGPPDADGAVEIAYGVDLEHQGRGYATEAAWGMTQYALDSGVVRVVRAHTLPHESASTRVLTKCGFSFLGEVVDPEDGPVWRWEFEQRHVQSRRDFLAMSAWGLVGLASTRRKSEGDAPAPEYELLYVGTYTDNTKSEGIYLVRMDVNSGALRVIGTTNAGANPSFLTIHPNGRALYTVNEVLERNGKAAGAVSAFTIAADTGALSRVDEQSSEGGAPCYVSADRTGRVVLVANYVGGNVALLPIQARGGLAAATHVVQHRGTGPNKERQEAPHAHCIVPDPSNVYALAADLGTDRILVYHMDLDAGALHEVGATHLRPGAGPRHLTFHPGLPLVFVANELDSTVTSLRFDAASGALTSVQTTSTIPAEFTGANYPADIHLATSGHALYVSNRGHNSIAVFSVARGTGALALEQTLSTGGDWPRNFSLDPTGKWLLVANQRSGDVVVFARDATTGRLTPTSQRLALPSPVCLRFRVHDGSAT